LLQGHIPGLEVIPRGKRLHAADSSLQELRQGVGDDEPLLVIDDISVPAGSLGTALAQLSVHHDVARIDVLERKDALSATPFTAHAAPMASSSLRRSDSLKQSGVGIRSPRVSPPFQSSRTALDAGIGFPAPACGSASIPSSD